MSTDLIRGLYDYHRWLGRWKGTPPMGDLRRPGTRSRSNSVRSSKGSAPPIWPRPVSFKNNQGIEATAVLGPLLQHVANHATHHRSEIGTMITLQRLAPGHGARQLSRDSRQGLTAEWSVAAVF